MPIALGVIPDSATVTHNANDWYVGVIAPISDSIMALEGDGALSSPLPTWTPLTLAGAWVYYGAPFATPAVRKNGDYVQCKGLIKSGAVGTLFTLPVGYRPSFQQQLIANSSAFQVATIQVAASGVVTLISLGGGTNAYLSLDHLIFDLGA